MQVKLCINCFYISLDPFNLDHNLGGGITNKSMFLVSILCNPLLLIMPCICIAVRAYILDRFMDTLLYHSEDRHWKNIVSLGLDTKMTHASAFIICNIYIYMLFNKVLSLVQWYATPP